MEKKTGFTHGASKVNGERSARERERGGIETFRATRIHNGKILGEEKKKDQGRRT